MIATPRYALFVAAMAIASPSPAQVPTRSSQVESGRYAVDVHHTQVLWSVNHLGITALSGAFGASGGSMQLDPARTAAAKVVVTFSVADMSTTSAPFAKHLSGADFFDVARFPTATFTSTDVRTTGNTARIAGNLTIKGVTKPITLDARLFGSGVNPRSKKMNIGFSATGKLKRSDFGLGYGAPAVGDEVDLSINAAFERAD